MLDILKTLSIRLFTKFCACLALMLIMSLRYRSESFLEYVMLKCVTTEEKPTDFFKIHSLSHKVLSRAIENF